MGKGKGQGDQTVTQTNVPEYAEPYVMDILDRAGAESRKGYTAYGNERIAGQNEFQGQQAGIVQGLGTGINGMGQAQDMTRNAAGMIGQVANLGPGKFSQAGFSGAKFGGAKFNEAGFGDAGTYGQQASQYMSPYMQNVVDVQKQQAMLDFGRAQNSRDTAAVKSGAFGGGRDAVVNAMAQEGLSRQMGQIQAQGLQDAYGQGMSAFQDDRGARMETEAMRAGEMARVQAGQAGELGRVQEGRAGELSRVQAGRAGELGRVQDARNQANLDFGQLRLGASGQMGDMGAQLAQLGGAERQAAVEQAGLLGQLGSDQQAEQQQLLDVKYQDFLRQNDWNRDQLEFYNNLIRGNVPQMDTTQTLIQQSNPWRDMIGFGMAAGGLGAAGGM